MHFPHILLTLVAVEGIATHANCSVLPVVRKHANPLQIDEQGVSIFRHPRQELPHNVVFFQADPPAAAHGAVTCNSQPCTTYCTAVRVGIPPNAFAFGGTSSCTYAFETIVYIHPDLGTVTIEKVKASCCCAFQWAYYHCVTEDKRPVVIPNHQGILAECHAVACRAFCEAHRLRHFGCSIDNLPPSSDSSFSVLTGQTYQAWSCNCFKLEIDDDTNSSLSDAAAVGGRFTTFAVEGVNVQSVEAIPLWQGTTQRCASVPGSTSFRTDEPMCLMHENAGRICVPLTITVMSSARKRKRAQQITGEVSRSEKPKLQFLEILAGKLR